MINPMELTGKHVLITGGSSGIGRQCAIQASRLGARVSVIARREEDLKQTVSMMDNPSKHTYFTADLSETDKVEELVKSVVNQRGAIDGFCHAAGLATVRTVKLSKPAFVEKMFRVNTFSFIELVRCLGLRGNMNNGASLVGISSYAAKDGNISQGIYSAAKAAMDGFLQPAAKEFGACKIRLNTVAFAMVDTAMFQEFLDNGGDPSLMKRQYLGVIDKEGAANAVMFLLSDASQYITATVLPVYAGY